LRVHLLEAIRRHCCQKFLTRTVVDLRTSIVELSARRTGFERARSGAQATSWRFLFSGGDQASSPDGP
jgi:hypothetical protein